MEQPTYGITDLGTWLDGMEGKIFRYVVKKHIFTPYEQDKRFSDESIYEDGGYWNIALITKAIETPDGTLIEFLELTEDDDCFENTGRYHYHLLKDIKLVLYDNDNDGREIIEHV